MDIIDKLLDLQKQATTEHSHFYVASCVTEAIQEITVLRSKLNVSKCSAPLLAQEVYNLYEEILNAVETKWANESRHTTVLRYITEHENRIDNGSKCGS